MSRGTPHLTLPFSGRVGAKRRGGVTPRVSGITPSRPLRGRPPPSRGRWSARALAALTLLLITPAQALTPAPGAGPCSLEAATPVTVAAIDDTFELLLDDGRRAALSGLEFPAEKPLAAETAARLSAWLAGREVFLTALGASPDRWGRTPAAVFAAQDDKPDSPLVSAGAALLEAGLARFRPDRPAASCAKTYLAAEAAARESKLGLWSYPAFAVLDAGAEEERFVNLKGMILSEGTVASVGETKSAIYLNFGPRRGYGFAAVISRRDLDIFERAEIHPRTLTGRRVRVRGLIDTTSGPRLDVVSPSAIEILDGAATR